MYKKRKIDYILEQDDDERLIFRFYPRRSSCHSFRNEPPKSWNDVFKVYYSYAIIKQYRSDDIWESEVVFDSGCDECSIIDEIGHRCLLLADGTEVFTREDGSKLELLDNRIRPFGMGVEWTISKRTVHDIDDNDNEIVINYYKFTLFDWWDKGYRFTLNEKDLKAFGEYLLGCCEYMLEHGDPI